MLWLLMERMQLSSVVGWLKRHSGARVGLPIGNEDGGPQGD